MSKTYKKKYEDDFDEYENNLKQRAIDRRKKKRFVRALKVMDVDELLEINDTTEIEN
jgi:hypothetical protein